MNSSPFTNSISNQSGFFLTSSIPVSQNIGFGVSNSPFNSTTQNSLFSAQSNSSIGFPSSTSSTNQPSVFGSTNSNSFGNFLGGSNNSMNSSILSTSTANTIFSNKTQGSILNNQNSITSAGNGMSYNGSLPQSGFNNGNQNTHSTNLSFGTSNSLNPAVGLFGSSSSTFGSSSNTVTSQPMFGSNSTTNSTSVFGMPSTSYGASNSGGFTQFGSSSFTNAGLNPNSVSVTSTKSIVSQPELTLGMKSSQASNAFPFITLQQNPVFTNSNPIITTQSSFGFQPAPLQSTVSTIASSNTFSFGSPSNTSNIGTNISSSISKFSPPQSSLSTGVVLTPTTSLMLNTTSNKIPTPNFSLNPNLSAVSTVSQTGFSITNTGLGGVSSSKIQINCASPLASSSVSAKKGLGGSPISDSSKLMVSKDTTQKISVVKQIKDVDLLPELKETVENFKQFVTEQKKLKEEIIKSNEVLNLMTRVEEESQILRQSISDVANGLQKIQVQSNKLKTDISKEQSNIKIAQTSSDAINIVMERGESSSYFTNKVRELENLAGLYLQEIEVVESMCNSSSKSTLTTRDLVEIIRRMDDEFIGLAAQLYVVHERVKVAKTEYLRRYKQANNHQNPFLAIEGRFGDTFESINELNNYKKSNSSQNSALKFSDNVGSSPFDNNCYINQLNSSFSIPRTVNTVQKPTIFGINTNNPTINSCAVTATTSPFSFSATNSSFSLNKPPTNLFLNETVSNKKRR